MSVSAFRRAATAAAVATGIVLISATGAAAHVGVSSPDAAAGGFGKLVFRVPSESDTAKTESVTVTLPSDTPFRFVSTKAIPGWTAETRTEKLDEPVTGDGFEITEAVTEVTWTAEPGSALNPHEFQEFEMSVGSFPEGVDQMSFPTVQTYSDGEVANWNQPTVEGEEEPEKPAPVLDLTEAAGGAGGAGAAAAAADATPASAPVGTTEESDGVARMLGGAGLALGLLALVGVALTRGRRT